MEDARSRMTDPPGRARLVERFPYLYPCLCTLYFQLGRYEDLLEAIEASKCRIRADLVTKESGEPATERDFSSDLHELGPLLSRLNSHYYSCFVDDDCVYGVLLSSRGVVKAARIPINRERIEYYASISNPELWGQPDPIDPVRRRIPEDLTQKLSLFVKVLKTALEQHELQEGDHICYSAHDALLDIPFHYMDVNGSQLVDYFSLSRIPDVHALVKVLKKEAYIARKYTYIDVPSLQDMDGKEGSRAPGELGRWLANHLSDGRHLLGEEADRETLVQEELGESILHFSTHGSNPGEKNPGILLAANQKLPDIALISRGGAEEHLLSAQVLFRLETEMNKSHITLQAWVPNSVKKGTKTDPPGLIWVFLHKGAASMLTANWQVPSRTAALFINTFYKYWLELGYSRSKAWRATVLELKNTDQSSHPHQWAAFSLSGDWR
jgi:hypothetical protein